MSTVSRARLFFELYHGPTFVHVPREGVAAVQLDVVDLPVGESESVQLEVAQDSRITCTGVIPIVLVNPKFQPFRMNLHTSVGFSWLKTHTNLKPPPLSQPSPSAQHYQINAPFQIFTSNLSGFIMKAETVVVLFRGFSLVSTMCERVLKISDAIKLKRSAYTIAFTHFSQSLLQKYKSMGGLIIV